MIIRVAIWDVDKNKLIGWTDPIDLGGAAYGKTEMLRFAVKWLDDQITWVKDHKGVKPE